MLNGALKTDSIFFLNADRQAGEKARGADIDVARAVRKNAVELSG